jgi:hypothetical protein
VFDITKEYRVADGADGADGVDGADGPHHRTSTASNSFTFSTAVRGYRPTNEMCVMRNMAAEHFCPRCAKRLCG